MDAKTNYGINSVKRKLLKSINNNEFIIYLQPKFNTFTEKLVGAEALIRKKVENKII